MQHVRRPESHPTTFNGNAPVNYKCPGCAVLYGHQSEWDLDYWTIIPVSDVDRAHDYLSILGAHPPSVSQYELAGVWPVYASLGCYTKFDLICCRTGARTPVRARPMPQCWGGINAYAARTSRITHAAGWVIRIRALGTIALVVVGLCMRAN